MDSSGPILVKTAVPEEEIVEGSRTVTQEQRILFVEIPEEVLSSVVENTADLRENLNKFINGLNSKIQSV